MKRLLRTMLWVWLGAGVSLGVLGALDPSVGEWLAALAQEVHR